MKHFCAIPALAFALAFSCPSISNAEEPAPQPTLNCGRVIVDTVHIDEVNGIAVVSGRLKDADITIYLIASRHAEGGRSLGQMRFKGSQRWTIEIPLGQAPQHISLFAFPRTLGHGTRLISSEAARVDLPSISTE
jgi:hypothetical protein